MVTKASSTETDAYTQHVMGAIDPEVFKTLNLVQLQGIRAAICANAPFRKHPVDIRGTLPLYFLTYYFVFLMGKDRRSATRERERLRLRYMKGLGAFAFVYTFIAAAIPLLFLVLYLLKSLLGIDIFSDQHLSDLLF
ncbi:hypothetical protein [Teredinibacter haidensis]|uniref:hypothetical protein n=1 Tax=Teredinibacter haidensis TaxID=2731755 RepID=UPI000948D49A|nr:hypothetical protein [Teredinibacter haidensis]